VNEIVRRYRCESWSVWGRWRRWKRHSWVAAAGADAAQQAANRWRCSENEPEATTWPLQRTHTPSRRRTNSPKDSKL